MTRARKSQISLDATPYYHVVSRCVRRAFLCGYDRTTGTDFEHRRQWIEDRILLLADVFAIDICAYAVMSNHVHLVLHINAKNVHSWSDKAVCERWHKLYKGTPLTQKFANNEPLTKVELFAVKERITQWRWKLFDISTFMKALNEPIARMANAEDKCTGRFWEGRFKSQALCDEAALAACMAYVDLNPIRAKMAKTPETSDHTSIKRRVNAVKNRKGCKGLFPFAGNPRELMPQGLPFRFCDYLEIVDWSGRAIRDGKRGSIHQTQPPILERLGIEPENWLTLTQAFEKNTNTFVGADAHIKLASQTLGYQRVPYRSKNLF